MEAEVTTAAPSDIGPLQRIGAAFAKRTRRLRPDRVHGGFLMVLLTLWVSAVVTAVVLVFMDPDQVNLQPASGGDPVDRFFAPLWLREVLMAAIAVLAVSACVLAALSADLGGARSQRREVRYEVVLAVAAGFPAFALAADRQLLLAGIASVAFLGVEITAHLPVIGRRGWASIPIIAALVLVPWLIMLIAQLFGGVPSGGWTWASLFWFAATFAVFGAYYGLVRASEVRVKGLAFTKRRDLRPAVAWTCVLIVLGLVILRSTVANGLFNESDAEIWTPWQKAPTSWVIAASVAMFIALAAVRSSIRPFRRYGERLIAGTIAATGVLELVLSWVAVVIGMIVAIVSGANVLPDAWVDWYQPVQLAIIVLLAVVACLPAFRRTASRAIAWASALYLIPALLLIVFIANAPSWYSVATSVQVVLVLLAIAIALGLWNLVGRTHSVGWRVVARLAVVPLVVVHAGLLLPAVLDWSARYVLIVGAVLSLLLFLPKVAADPRRRALDLIGASSAVLLSFVVAVMALPSTFKAETWGVTGTLWLPITVITGLVLELEPRLFSGSGETAAEGRREVDASAP
ncbi:hypothetical protein [Agromyces sp. NPDC057865]|uniref:hypothetical protein n=1 Tax=Agromyces sp. NPDC057865 TaxID=3346267 RepID=UPI00366B9589